MKTREYKRVNRHPNFCLQEGNKDFQGKSTKPSKSNRRKVAIYKYKKCPDRGTKLKKKDKKDMMLTLKQEVNKTMNLITFCP